MNAEDALPEVAEQAALQEVISMLTPLREHRQAMAERRQRQADHDLQRCRDELTQAETTLASELDQQQGRRKTLAQQHVNQAQTLKDIDRWHKQEYSMLDHLSRLRQTIVRCTQSVEQQRLTLEQARDAAKAALRAQEKLVCLSEVINDEN